MGSVGGLIARMVIALACASTVSGFSVAAHGQGVARIDASNDVIHRTYNADDTTVVDPDRANGDILRFRAAHGRYRLTARFAFRELTKDATTPLIHLSIPTDGSRFAAMAYLDEDNKPRQQLQDAEGQPNRCPGMRSKMDFAEDTLWMAIPRSCLGRPRWVRLGPRSVAFVNDDEGVLHSYLDRAIGGGDIPGLTRRLWRG